MRRVIGQCHQADFEGVEHLAAALDDPTMLDTSTLTSRQKFAFHFIAVIKDKGISWKLMRSVVSEVLFWGEGGDKITHVEVKLTRDPSRHGKVLEFNKLWGW